MTAEPLVSVVLPTYNRREMLADAIASVLAQSLTDLELIVVDDGSTDDTKAMIERGFDRVRYIETPHGGPAHARNVGMRVARGRYIAFLDSDDVYEPWKLAVQVAFLQSHPEVDLVSTEARARDDKGVWTERHLRSMHSIYTRNGWAYGDVFERHGEFSCDAYPQPILFFEGNIFRRMLLGPLLLSPTVLFSRRILETVGEQNESYRLGEDYDFLVRISRLHRIALLDLPTYVIRYHGDQISRARQARTRGTIRVEIEIEENFLRTVLQCGLGDAEFYPVNRDWLDHRVAEIHHCIGEKWLDCGDTQRARISFLTGLKHEPRWAANRYALRLTYLPGPARRAVQRLVRAWTA